MNKLAIMTLFLSPLAYSADIPTLLDTSKILHIPVLKYQAADTTLYFSIDLKASPGFETFTPVYAEEVSAPSDANINEIGGNYSGVLSFYEQGTTIKTGPFLSCPPAPFNPVSTSLTIEHNENGIEMSIDVFPELVCILTGETATTDRGTFECSDFNKGTWISELTSSVDAGKIVAIKTSYTGDKCSFDTNFTGLRD